MTGRAAGPVDADRAARDRSRRPARPVLAPGTRLGALDGFAAAYPALARRLVPGSRPRERHFGRSLFERLDAVIRSERGDDAQLQLAQDFRDVIANPARGPFVDALVADGREASERRAAVGRARSLWGLTPIINLIPCAAADRRLGVEAETVVATVYYVTREFDVVLKEPAQAVLERAPGCYVPWTWAVFAWALLSFDHFYLFSDRGVLEPIGGYGSDRFGINLEEMRILRRAGKALYTMVYGADYRTRAKTLASGRFNLCMDCPAPGMHCLCDDDGGQRVLETIADYATATLGAGLALEYLPKPRPLNYLAIDLTRFRPVPMPSLGGRALRIAHAPNHSFFKGTAYLEAAIDRLRAEGYAVEMVKLSGVPNEEILRLMASADLVADQFISGNFGYTAIEAMALGKPVLAYVRETLPVDHDALPIINANPDTLYHILKDILTTPERLADIGCRSRRYVETYHSIEAVAQEIDGLYRATRPEAQRWLARPRRLAVRHWVRALALTSFDAARAACPDPVWNAARDVHNMLRTTTAAWAWLRWRGRTGLHRVALSLYRIARRLLMGLAVRVGRWSTARRLRQGTARTLWGTTPILTLPLLAQCDRRLGFESQSLVFTTYYTSQQFDFNLQPLLNRLSIRTPILHRVVFDCVLAWALVRFDVFHFFCDRGILPPAGRMGIDVREAVLLRRAGKRLYTYTYGADVRTREATLALGRYNFCVDCPEPGRFCICDDAAGRANIAAIAPHATAMVAMGDMLAYVPGARELAFWPLDLRRVHAVPPGPRGDRPLRVFHAPNHAHFKGSRHLERAVHRLGEEGHAIELVRVSGVPNEEVLRQMATCDVVAEQFIGGFHGYTALEAMALGKPVICYIRDRRRLVDQEACPILDADPDSLEAVLRGCVCGAYDLTDLGRRGRRYVEKYYSIDAVAARLGRLYLTTADLPEAARRRIEDQIASIEARLATVDVTAPVGVPHGV